MAGDDGLRNAVLVLYKGGERWVEDAASIAEWGRIEGSFSVDVADEDAVDAIGQEWLAARAWPRSSTLVEVDPAAGLMPDRAATVDVDGDEVRTVGRTFDWSSDNEETTRKVPEFETRTDARLVESGRAVERLIAQGGGRSAAAAPVVDRGTGIAVGKVARNPITPWSWNDPTELEDPDPESWPPQTIEEPTRLHKVVLKAKNDEAIGTTTFMWTVNGVEVSSLLRISLLSTETEKELDLYAFEGTLQKGAVLRVALALDGGGVTINGGHTSGSIQFFGAEPI